MVSHRSTRASNVATAAKRKHTDISSVDSCSELGLNLNHFCNSCQKNASMIIGSKKITKKLCEKPWVLKSNPPPQKIRQYNFLLNRYPDLFDTCETVPESDHRYVLSRNILGEKNLTQR